MKILKVIHGYPMRYNAGSEVYSQILCDGLAKRHDVSVFTREENPFVLDYSMRTERDPINTKIQLNLINLPLEKHRYCYRNSHVDDQFEQVLNNVKPAIVHIGHLNHLSVSLVERIPLHIPVIYTLHDYWLICPRGQFIQRTPKNIWALCDHDQACAINCYSGYFSGAEEDTAIDRDYWTSWVVRRKSYISRMVERVDYFLAPAHYLLKRYQQAFNFSKNKNKLIYLDYGFDLARLKNRVRVPDELFTFGYIGTHIPMKGIQLLLQAFGQLQGDAKLRIWGRPRGQNTEALKELAKMFPSEIQERIEWLPEYRNQHIIQDVFNHVDAIVVSSIWVENSPLVIHEALQARVPVITADVGGMSEYIHHQVNGLLFKHRDVGSLTEQMQQLVNHPDLANQLSSKGYIQSKTGDIPNIEDHVRAIECIYENALREKGQR